VAVKATVGPHCTGHASADLTNIPAQGPDELTLTLLLGI